MSWDALHGQGEEQKTHVVDVTVGEQTSTAGNDRNDGLGEALGAFEGRLLLLLGGSLLGDLGLEVGLLLLEEVEHGGIRRPGGCKLIAKVVYYSGFRGEETVVGWRTTTRITRVPVGEGRDASLV